MRSIRTTLIVVASALIAVALFAASAQACSYENGEAVFSRWGDQRSYVLAPDGGFEEGAAGWSLQGASVVPGNESAYLDGASDSQSLALPEGSSATSPTFCFSAETPFLRMMASGDGRRVPLLRVDIVYPDLGVARTRIVLGFGSGWFPTQPFPLSLAAASDGSESVQVRLTALRGDWRVDDVYVDPFARY